MRKLAAIFLLILLSLTASAQKKQIDSLNLALSKAHTDTDRYEILRLLNIQYTLSKPDSAIIVDEQCYLLAEKNHWLFNQARSLTSIANEYNFSGDYVKAMQIYLKALRIAREIDDVFLISTINNNIGDLNMRKEDYKNALLYFRRADRSLNTYAVTHQLLVKHKRIKAIIYSNIGECYLDIEQLDSAAYYLTTSYNDCKNFNITDQIGVTQRDLGEVEAAKGKKADALQFFKQAAKSDLYVNDGEDLSITYLSTANLYHKFKQQDSAIYYAQKALSTASNGKFEQDVLNAGKALYTFYDENHNLPEAYKYFKITTAAKDSLYSQDKVKQLLSLDFDEKERQQELQVAQKEARAEAENRLRTYIFSGGLGVLLLLAIIFWRNGNQRKKANHLLSKQKREIEDQRDETNKALTELKLTQNQLIQSEKMASLGELTAGIAHEIQNPLNFVNNFSEVNTELIAEMNEEIEKGDLNEIKTIAADIEENSKKINMHGKRADFIVKGMLQHSRASTGERQLTNINILAEEFLKLSYQGLRAKDKSFNAELTTHFDANLPKVNVVQQDIGRVLLNLFNNAFYAVNQKQKTIGNDYKPEVSVTTSTETGQLIIKVKDNGIGIPDAVKDKIMQPFFTTKPTGEGTGLGLSLSYDIVVKGHGGSINVNTKEGEYTEFTIALAL